MKIPVLFYHHVNSHSGDTVTVTTENFASQIEYLYSEGYESISADQLMRFIAGEYTPSGKVVLITFDDGWLDNYFNAIPILKRYSFNATFFLITGRVNAVVSSTFRNLSPDHEICKKLVNSGRAGDVAIGWGLAKELDKDNLFDFYSHTVSHRHCVTLKADELIFELEESKRKLEEQLGRPCDYLCWPYGSFNQSALECAAQIGYKGTFSTIDGFCTRGSDPFLVNRIEVRDSLEWFKSRLSAES
ncbi:MAG: polysaccharide deacetylase family protein [Geobacteraceae bacterium]|nr:polysaccharide deacetylase family protein [Geobacteraceae bacterium]